LNIKLYYIFIIVIFVSVEVGWIKSLSSAASKRYNEHWVIPYKKYLGDFFYDSETHKS